MILSKIWYTFLSLAIIFFHHHYQISQIFYTMTLVEVPINMICAAVRKMHIETESKMNYPKPLHCKHNYTTIFLSKIFCFTYLYSCVSLKHVLNIDNMLIYMTLVQPDHDDMFTSPKYHTMMEVLEEVLADVTFGAGSRSSCNLLCISTTTNINYF